jgi:hypothetical protein
VEENSPELAPLEILIDWAAVEHAHAEKRARLRNGQKQPFAIKFRLVYSF